MIGIRAFDMSSVAFRLSTKQLTAINEQSLFAKVLLIAQTSVDGLRFTIRSFAKK
jgi:hypothetical protein